MPERSKHHQAFMLWSGLWVDGGSEGESLRVHHRVMLGYAAALEEAMKEGKWPLFCAEPLSVLGSYGLSAPWKVAAVAVVLLQVSGLGSGRNDPAVWGVGGPGCLESANQERKTPASDLAMRWGASPGPLSEGDIRLWLTHRGAYADNAHRAWLARDCGQELTVRVLPQTTPEGVSRLLSTVNRDY